MRTCPALVRAALIAGVVSMVGFAGSGSAQEAKGTIEANGYGAGSATPPATMQRATLRARICGRQY